MEARQAYKMIQWYNVYVGEVGSDREDDSIYYSLLDSLKDCHDMIEEVGMTYHQYYEYRLNVENEYLDYPDDLDIAFEESLLD